MLRCWVGAGLREVGGGPTGVEVGRGCTPTATAWIWGGPTEEPKAAGCSAANPPPIGNGGNAYGRPHLEAPEVLPGRGALTLPRVARRVLHRWSVPNTTLMGPSSWSATATGREVGAAPRGTPTAQPHPTGSKLKLQPPTPHKAQPTPSCPRPHCQPAPRRAPPAAFLQGTAELRAGQGDNIGPMRPPRSQMCVNKAAAP